MLRNNLKKILAYIIAANLAACAFAQGNDAKKTDVAAIISSKHFSFIPQIVVLMEGRSRQVDNTFSLTVNNDTLISSLPYFGRAYDAPADPAKNALDFTSVNYTFGKKENKKNTTVVLKTNDLAENITYNLTVYDNGNATLNMLSNNRQSISYNGNITGIHK